ncbi:putative deacylase [Thermanaerovibrio velox DSM 12556]|uniref:Putative deacylase n=1 Tax=Thermanaerovibrio velox DSM 12556 TaxID=926567 RepID=H0UR11_9BACT|nr:succinylglutamate desuccinylase/aspartoacylase family protein [Thermanaerovibrio velox]EHM10848.1 putative deacylase [Thermanaerovibrio velox DSM 12556]
MKATRTSGLVMLALAGILCFAAARDFRAMWARDRVFPAPGFRMEMLSKYLPSIKGTGVDTEVYVQEGPEKGGTVFVLGGTHPNEPAGYLSAVVMLENARVKRGRLIVVPFGNASGFTHNQPQEASPSRISFKLPDGSERSFRYGSRDVSPLIMWPVPDVYVHKASGQALSGNESRNLNRAYPGDPAGTPAERLAYAIMELLRRERVDLAFDLHEASPEYPVVDAIVAHEKSMEVAAGAAMDLKLSGIEMRLEPSPKKLRGLSHREWGDGTGAMPFLIEVANPSQGRLRGRTDERLVKTGLDKAYLKASGLGRLFVPYDSKGKPIEERVGRQLATVMSVVSAFSDFNSERGVVIEGVPAYEEMVSLGIGAFLKRQALN